MQALASLTPEAFAANVQAVVDTVLEKDKNLNQETARYWDEISSRSYLFDRNVQEAAMVASLTSGDILEFHDLNFSMRGAGRRKVSTWVYGNQHRMEDDDGGEEVESGGEASISKEGSKGAGLETFRDDGCIEEGQQSQAEGGENGKVHKRPVVIIGDYSEFKRSMPLLPLRSPAPVAAVVKPSKL